MGIYLDSRRGKWVARGATENGVREYLGSFKTEEEAQFAFDLYESKKAHLKDSIFADTPDFYEQTGTEQRFPAVMVKRLKVWAMDKLQKLRTDKSERG